MVGLGKFEVTERVHWRSRCQYSDRGNRDRVKGGLPVYCIHIDHYLENNQQSKSKFVNH